VSETPEPTREQLECFIESGAENDGDVYQLAVWRLALEALDRRAEFDRLAAKVAEQAAEIERLKDCPMLLCPYEERAKTAEAKLRAVEALCMSSIATNATLIPSDAQEGGNFDGEDAMAHRVLAILEAKP